MWWLGIYLDRARLALLLVLNFPLLVGLSYISGFKKTYSWREAVADAAVAFLVGLLVGGIILWLFNIVRLGEPADDLIAKIGLQAVPASFGAVLANSQFAADAEQQGERQPSGYPAELFLMVVGAVFLAFNVAPTQEMIIIAYRLTPVRALLLVGLTLLLMHGFVYGASFRGAPDRPPGTPWWHLFLAYSVVGYILALLVSGYVLWSFGRFQGHDPIDSVRIMVVLGFPAGLGAAAARLII